MDEKEFIDRAHKRYAEKAGLGYEEARAAAEALWDGGSAVEYYSDTPEQLVDADLKDWADDGSDDDEA